MRTINLPRKSLEWAERIASAEGYLAAQYHLFDAVVNGAEEDTVVRRLDDVRRANSMFRSAQFLEGSKAKETLTDDLESGVEYLELVKQIKGNEARLDGWLAVVDEEQASVRSFFDAKLKFLAAPDSDIFLADGESEQAIYDELIARGYKRVLRWSDFSDPSQDDGVDLVKLQKAVFRFEALRDIKPGDVWYLNFEAPDDEDKRATKINVEIQRLYIPRNTAETFSERWTVQTLRNIPHFMQQGRDLEGLRDRLKGSSAVVVGAGPSVDDAIDWIKAQQPRPIVICAFKALKALYAADIVPDLVVCLDPAQHARHLVGVDTSKLGGFIAEVGMSSEVIERIECPIFPYIGNLVSSEIVACLGLNKEIAVIQSGGTVLSGALQAAIVLGCEEINLIGADFGFPDDRLYAVGAGTGDRFAIDGKNKAYVRKPLDANARAGALVEVETNDGKTILSSVEMIDFRRWVEAFAKIVQKERPGVQFYNLSAKGARVEGVPFVEMSLHRVKAFEGDVAAAIAGSPVFPPELFAKVMRRQARQVARLRELQAICERALRTARGAADPTSRMLKVVNAAKKCPEVSGILSKQLISIEERRRANTFDAQSRLKELMIKAAEACAMILKVYQGYPDRR